MWYGVMLGWNGEDDDDFDVDYVRVLASTEEEARRHQDVRAIEEYGFEVIWVQELGGE